MFTTHYGFARPNQSSPRAVIMHTDSLGVYAHPLFSFSRSGHSLVRAVTRHAAFLIKTVRFCVLRFMQVDSLVGFNSNSASSSKYMIVIAENFCLALRPSVGETAHPTRDPRAQLGQNRPENPKLRPSPRAARKNEKNQFGTLHSAPDAKIRGQKAPTVRAWCLV